MPAPSSHRRGEGPFLVRASVLLLAAGLAGVALGAFNLIHEFHAGQVDRIYLVAALAVGLIWLASIILAWRGLRPAIFAAGAIAFVEFGTVATTHFVSGPGALGTFVKHEGLPVATAAMLLIPACTLTAMAAAVCWSHRRGRNPKLETLPILVVAVAGTLLVILAATDSVHRIDFGSANTEDGAFIASAAATIWLVGALWLPRVRRIGALLVALGSFGVWSSFVTLHLVKGGTSLRTIASNSGPVWAIVAVAAAVLAAASFVAALGLLGMALIRRRPAALPAGSQPASRRV